MDKLYVKKLRPEAIIPKRGTPGSAGSDLSACIAAPVLVAPGETEKIPTGIAIAIPEDGFAAFVFARSGLGIKHGISPANCVGVIDSDYRGEIVVGLHNSSKEPYTINPGDRIAQLVIMPVVAENWAETEELPESLRGDGGFGSTGK